MLVPLWQKIIGIFIYMLPWSEALPFGRYLFTDLPFIKWLIIPALPIIFIQRLIPFGGFILFIMIFLLVIRNPKVPYFLRFNSLQAILINIGLIIINYLFEILFMPFGNSLLIKTFSSTILIGTLGIMIFSIFECIQGKEPDLPGISAAVKIQL
tara:strand:- start:7710 stop:8171 length:462 start_codon:yes stop_codon:yes gene_type:complete